MPSSIRSSSRERISAFFSRSSSRSRRAESDDTLQNAPPSSFEATGRNKLIRARSESNTPTLNTLSSVVPTPTTAYPPSSFKSLPESKPKISRRQSWGSAIDSILRPPSLFGDATNSRSTSPTPTTRSASKPPSIAGSRANSRPPSRDSVSLQTVPQITPLGQTTDGPTEKKTSRKSWLPRSSRSKAKVEEKVVPAAWIAGDVGKMSYNTAPLTSAEPVRELWDEGGDTLVYLFPRTSDKGPSFKVRSSIYASSSTLTKLAHGGSQHGRREKRKSQALEHQIHPLHSGGLATPPTTPKVSTPDNGSSGSSRATRASEIFREESPRQISLYLPITLSTDVALLSSHEVEIPMTQDDVEKLIGVRNLFAFLLGQSIVATDRRPTLFTLFLDIAQSLRFYDFTNIDGSTFGEVADTSFDCYVDELGLADIRLSREKTTEALVLGEKMRSALLYNEAFVHAVGKYNDLQTRTSENNVKYNLISLVTRNRMERAWIDLQHREKSVNTRLLDFDFPSLFAGILDSKTADERKIVNFGAWKDAFLATRKHVMSYYKQKYGSWPPKSSSKKTGPLSRIVLRDIYTDFSGMYDLFVDRTSRTTRTSDVIQPTKDDDGGLAEPVARVLRRVFDEYDRSSPPVQPPVPYDTPLLPVLSVTGDPQRDAKTRNRKLKDDELLGMLANATNRDTLPFAVQDKSRFLASIRWFERREARNRNVAEIVSLRAGMWMFLYVVLQALPMLVVDAPGVRYHNNVEYFLCVPPRNGLPWVAASASDGGRRGRGRSWYGVTGGTGVVSLPSDVVEHGVEGVYRRSHCWIMATKWKEQQHKQEAHQTDAVQPEEGWRTRQYFDDMSQQEESNAYFVHESHAPPPILTEPSAARATSKKRPTPLQRPPSLSGRPPSIHTVIESTSFTAGDWPTPLAPASAAPRSLQTSVQNGVILPASPAFTPTSPMYNSPMSYHLPSPYQQNFPPLFPQPQSQPPPNQHYQYQYQYQYQPQPQPTYPTTSIVPPQIPPMSIRRPQSIGPTSSYNNTANNSNININATAPPTATSSTTSLIMRPSSQGPVGRIPASPSAWRPTGTPYGASRDSVVAMGLEALPLPPGVALGGGGGGGGGGSGGGGNGGGYEHVAKESTGNEVGGGVGSRPGSAQGASTFDEIIGSMERERGRSGGRNGGAGAKKVGGRRSGSWVRGVVGGGGGGISGVGVGVVSS